MTVTAQNLIDQTLRRFYTNQSPQVNILGANITANASSPLTMTMSYDVSGISAGCELCIGIERFHVLSAPNPADKTVVVQRAWGGTTAAAHTSGDVVQVKAQIDNFDAFNALNEELDDLSAPSNGLFKVSTVTLTADASRAAYNLTSVTNVEAILRVYSKFTGQSGDWQRLNPSDWQADQSQDTGDFASGYSLRVGNYQPGQSIRVLYKDRFTRFSATTSDAQSDAGLPATANDIPVLGAVIRLRAGAEISRNFTDSQGSTRRADEVPASANLRSTAAIAALRASRINAEAGRLLAKYPEML